MIFYRAQLDYLATVITNKYNKANNFLRQNQFLEQKSAMSYVLFNWLNIWQAQQRKGHRRCAPKTSVNQTPSGPAAGSTACRDLPWAKEVKCWLLLCSQSQNQKSKRKAV